MPVEILLMNDVEGLGSAGQVVKVAEGYARNYLLPKKLGAPVTEGTRRQLAKLQAERETARKLALEAAQAMAERLQKVSCTFPMKTGPEGRLFGSVTAADIAESFRAQGMAVDKHQVGLDAPIKELGTFDVPIRLHPDVTVTTKVWVVQE